MPRIELETWFPCSPEEAFDRCRDISLHEKSASQTRERAIAGRRSGLIELGETVTWEATHFFIRQRLTVKITKFDRPRQFRDSMVRGAFAGFDHDHFFEPSDGGTLAREVFEYRSPLGVFGRLADRIFLERYMRRFLEKRNQFLLSTL